MPEEQKETRRQVFSIKRQAALYFKPWGAQRHILGRYSKSASRRRWLLCIGRSNKKAAPGYGMATGHSIQHNLALAG